MLGQLLEAHVVDDEQVGLEVAAQEAVTLGEGLPREEVGDEVEDGPVAHDEALLDGLVADCLGEVGLADAGRADQEDVVVLADEVPGGQLEDVLAGDGGIEAPAEVVEGAQGGELDRCGAARDPALRTDVELVLEDQFEELRVGEPVGVGLLEADREGLDERRPAQLLEDRVEVHAGQSRSRL